VLIGEIFLASIKQMTVTDGINILRGGDFAETDFLKRTTSTTLTERMRPIIHASLKKVNADKYWSQAFFCLRRYLPAAVSPAPIFREAFSQRRIKNFQIILSLPIMQATDLVFLLRSVCCAVD
jgi:Protein of unknown function (DUF4197)